MGLGFNFDFLPNSISGGQTIQPIPTMSTLIKKTHGGMISGDTVLITQSGLKRARDTGDDVIWNVGSWGAVTVTPTKTKHHIWRVTMSDGTQLMCGKKHPWAILSDQGSLRSVMTDELEIGAPVIANMTVHGACFQGEVFNARTLGENIRKKQAKIPQAMMNANPSSVKEFIQGWLNKHGGLVGHPQALAELDLLLSSLEIGKCRITCHSHDVYAMFVNSKDKAALGIQYSNLYQDFELPRVYVRQIEQLKNRQLMYVVEPKTNTTVLCVGGFVSLASKPPCLTNSPTNSRDGSGSDSPVPEGSDFIQFDVPSMSPSPTGSCRSEVHREYKLITTTLL